MLWVVVIYHQRYRNRTFLFSFFFASLSLLFGVERKCCGFNKPTKFKDSHPPHPMNDMYVVMSLYLPTSLWEICMLLWVCISLPPCEWYVCCYEFVSPYLPVNDMYVVMSLYLHLIIIFKLSLSNNISGLSREGGRGGGCIEMEIVLVLKYC